MNGMLLFPGAVKRAAVIDVWLSEQLPELGAIAREWFTQMRSCGDDVRELMHDGYPVACVDDAPFCYVNVFKAHANVGFFYGAELNDPQGLLEGSGKRMRHVKVKPGAQLDSAAMCRLDRRRVRGRQIAALVGCAFRRPLTSFCAPAAKTKLRESRMTLPTNLDYPIIAIADLHGQSDQLKQLVTRLNRISEWDDCALVFLGDYVDRGEDVPGTIDMVLELLSRRPGGSAVLGNHDLALLRAARLDDGPRLALLDRQLS